MTLFFMLLNFNSIIVRLKLASPKRNRTAYLYFNSIIVRLKPKDSTFTATAKMLFQFYNSSIKTELLYIARRSNKYFNSIIVRLKPTIPTNYIYSLINFNSIIVRLKR